VSAALALVALLGAAPALSSGYEARRSASSSRDALLAADDAVWSAAAAVTWGPAAYATRFRAAWTDEGLFLRFDATDPDPWHTMTRRDDHLWEEEVVEIFLDPGGAGRDYYELEISPANVVCDVLMIAPWPDKKQDFAWDLEGLLTHVRPHEDAAGKAGGWTATALLPWAGLRKLPSARGVAVPPRAGDRWRFNLFRVDRPGGKGAPDKGAIEAAWSPTGQASFHVPRAFRDLVFAGAR
jgi:hypothetical protein